jgi:hypothetical protein
MKLTKWAAVALAAAATGGCAACPTCRGDATPSPQTPQQGVPGWQPVPRGEPQPAPPVPRRDFQNPPADEGDTPPSPPPPGPAPPPPAVVPAPAPPPVPVTQNGRAKVTLTRETEGASVIIDQHAAGTIIVNSPGVATPAPAQGYAQALQYVQASPAPAQAFPVGLVTAVATNPQVISLVGATARRVGGALSYLATGQCPNKGVAAPAQYVQAAPQMVALQAVQSYQTVPVQMVQQVPVQTVAMAPIPAATPLYMTPMAAPTPQYLAAPQFAAQAIPETPKKCRLFGR